MLATFGTNLDSANPPHPFVRRNGQCVWIYFFVLRKIKLRKQFRPQNSKRVASTDSFLCAKMAIGKTSDAILQSCGPLMWMLAFGLGTIPKHLIFRTKLRSIGIERALIFSGILRTTNYDLGFTPLFFLFGCHWKDSAPLSFALGHDWRNGQKKVARENAAVHLAEEKKS